MSCSWPGSRRVLFAVVGLPRGGIGCTNTSTSTNTNGKLYLYWYWYRMRRSSRGRRGCAGRTAVGVPLRASERAAMSPTLCEHSVQIPD